jgi:hypothetical protein
MTPPLDELYLRWLHSQVSPVVLKNPSRTYWNFLKQLYEKEFVWFVPNDDNRAEDGKILRYEFLEECAIDEIDDDWLNLGCSMLEMFVGLSRRLAYETDDEPRDWFWRLVENLNLHDLNDRQYNESKSHEIDAALDRVIWRTYRPNGEGGLFPLNDIHLDQRTVEIWYQMNAYIIERHI